MAKHWGGDTARIMRSPGSLAATLVLSILSWACGESVAPTSLRQAGTAARAEASASTHSELIPGQYIITFADSVSDTPGLAKRIANQYGSSPMFTYTAAIKGFAARLPDRAVEALQHNPQIDRIEQDQTASADDAQLAPPSWGLDRIDQRSLPLDNRYSFTSTGAGVSVYIIDTGIRTTHQDFGGRAFGAFTSISDGYGTNDCNGHGTHVAGTVGGTVRGVAKQVKLYAVRVLDCTGSGSYSGIIAGVDWVTSHRVLPAVANMSLGGSASSTLNQAVQSSIKSGVVYAIAAGNSTADACGVSPASTPEALTVGASTSDDAQASFSNYGSCVDVFAPGWGILSEGIATDTSTASKSGTSMATPHVAGAAALYLSLNPTATPAGVASALLSSASDNVLTGVTAGTPNRLIYAGDVTVSAPTSPDTVSVPAPLPTPTVDKAPIATFTVSCPRGKCTFDATGSTDDRGIAAYSWNFGDGSLISSGPSMARVTHAYASAGTYMVVLKVTDSAGQSTTTQQSVTLKNVK